MSVEKQPRRLRKELKVLTREGCPACGGTGLKVLNEYSPVMRKLSVTIEVCNCVRVAAE